MNNIYLEMINIFVRYLSHSYSYKEGEASWHLSIFSSCRKYRKSQKVSSNKRGISNSILNKSKNFLQIWKANNKLHKNFWAFELVQNIKWAALIRNWLRKRWQVLRQQKIIFSKMAITSTFLNEIKILKMI